MIDVEPRIWWEEDGLTTRCVACGFERFPLVKERPNPHLCPPCTDLVEQLQPGSHASGHTQDQGPRHWHADAAASFRHPDTGRQAWAVADGIGDDYEPGKGAHLTVWAAAAAAVHIGAAGALYAAREVWHREYGDWPPGQEGNAVAVVAVAFDDAHGGGYDIAWCGDARAYTFQDGILTQHTTDHTVAERMRAKGLPEEWIGPADHHAVTSSVAKGDIASIRTTGPARLLLCSDGVYNALPPETITRGLRVFTDPSHAARRLVDAARRAGSTDNATALVVSPCSNRETAGQRIGVS